MVSTGTIGGKSCLLLMCWVLYSKAEDTLISVSISLPNLRWKPWKKRCDNIRSWSCPAYAEPSHEGWSITDGCSGIYSHPTYKQTPGVSSRQNFFLNRQFPDCLSFMLDFRPGLTDAWPWRRPCASVAGKIVQ